MNSINLNKTVPDGNKIPLSLIQQSGTVWKMLNMNNFAQCAVCLSIYSFSLPFLVSLLLVRFKKRLMIVKRVIRSVSRRRTNDTMDKIKRRKRRTTIHKTLEKQHELHYKTGMNSAVRKGSSSCSTNITGMNSDVRKGSSSCSTNITSIISSYKI